MSLLPTRMELGVRKIVSNSSKSADSHFGISVGLSNDYFLIARLSHFNAHYKV